MANNYSVSFKSLRAGILYTVNIGGGEGTAIPLKGGAQPFVTQEDDSDDMFTPIRTQTGYIRIVDDGKAEDGTTSFDWRDLIPSGRAGRLITLTHTVGNDTIIDWQGYIQSKNYGGELYGNPQEREFAIYCGLSALGGIAIDTSAAEPKSFAYIIYLMFHDLSAQYDTFLFQGGADARNWLRMRVDMRNFNMSGSDVPRLNAYDVLEEICRYWGWTARTQGQSVIFTCADDAGEQGWLELTSSDLLSLGDSDGTVTGANSDVTLSGDIFVSTDNDETFLLGCQNAVVKADVNKADSVVKFAPEDLEQEMGDPDMYVQNPDDPTIGYFRTYTKWTLGNGNPPSNNMGASALNSGGFERRIIYPSSETTKGTNADVIMIGTLAQSNTILASIETRRVMTFSGGSLSISGQLFQGYEPLNIDDDAYIIMSIGIGMTKASAKWFWIGVNQGNVSHGWSDEVKKVRVGATGSTIDCVLTLYQSGLVEIPLRYPKIPVATALHGYLYIDIYGMEDVASFEIANLEIKFERESTYISSLRPRTIPVDWESEHEYTSASDDGSGDTHNVDCIFASDYGGVMAYGYGLLMNPNMSFMETAPYNGDSEQPEQHLSNRVAAYGSKTRRRIRMELNSVAGNVGSVTPTTNVCFDGACFVPVSISREWRDDTTILTLQQIDEQ